MGRLAVNLVYAAPVSHSSFAQRAHHFVAFCNRMSGGRTLWINPYPSRLPRFSDLQRSRPGVYPLIDDLVEILSPPAWCADPIMHSSWLRQIVWKPVLKRIAIFTQEADWMLAIGRPSFLALHLLEQMKYSISCYDAMDDFPEFHRGYAQALNRQIESEIARRVDQIIVSSSTLREKFLPCSYEVELVRNGFDLGQPALRRIVRDNMVFGYIGTIGAWFDWALVAQMAHTLPEVRFDLVGPVMTPPKVDLPANVRCLGECSSEDLPDRLRRFTIGIIPFKVSRLTAAVDPIKYYEYRAAGLPVISTKFGEMRKRGSNPEVCLVDRYTDFRIVLKRLEALPPSSPRALGQFRMSNSWQSRFAQSSFLHSWLNGRQNTEG